PPRPRSKSLRLSPTAESTLLRIMMRGLGLKLGELGSWKSGPKILRYRSTAEISGGLTASALRKLKLSRGTPVAAICNDLNRAPPPITSAIAVSRLAPGRVPRQAGGEPVLSATQPVKWHRLG